MKDPTRWPSHDLVAEPTTGATCDAIKEKWIHPAVILVVTDLTDLDRLTPFALEQAAQTDSQLLLLHVLTAGNSMAADATGMPYYDPHGALDYAAKTMEPVCELARRQNITCHALVREGNPVREIGAVARQFRVDRVLAGTRSRSRLGKLLIGSVAEQVLRSVNLPVMTVGPEAHLPAEGGPRERVVLHATTLGETSRPSAALAARIADMQGAKLVLLHVLPAESFPPPALPFPYLSSPDQPENLFFPDKLPADAAAHKARRAAIEEAALEKLRRLGEETGEAFAAGIETRVVHGNASIEILAEAHELGAGLIVLGARSCSLLESIARDRTIYRVLAHARCPVLTLSESQMARAEKTA